MADSATRLTEAEPVAVVHRHAHPFPRPLVLRLVGHDHDLVAPHLLLEPLGELLIGRQETILEDKMGLRV